MKYQPDIIITNKNNQEITVVEVEDRVGQGPRHAASMYQRFQKTYTGNIPEYFLLVTRETVSLWKDSIKIQQGLAPIEFTIEPILKFYQEKMGDMPIGKGVFDYLVFQWLVDVTNGVGPKVDNSPIFTDFETELLGAEVRFGARG